MGRPKHKTDAEEANELQARFLRKLDALAENMAKAVNTTRAHKPKRTGGK